MAKYCKSCGARLDGITGLCPRCDENEIIKRYLGEQERWKKIKKRIICTLIAVLITALLIAGVLALNYFEVIDLPGLGLGGVFDRPRNNPPMEETYVESTELPPAIYETVPATEVLLPTEPTYALTLESVHLVPVENPVSSCYASSTNSGDKVTHDVMNLLDGDPLTNWTEGVSGNGVGEYVHFDFSDTYQLNSIRIRGGNRRDHAHYTANSRPARITMTFSDGSSESFTMHDVYESQVLTLSKPVMTSSLRITIDSVYAGNKYQDTVISDVFFETYEANAKTAQCQTSIKSCASIRFETRADGVESGVITGFGDAGEELWSYQSGEYELAQCSALAGIGVYGSTFYFVEAGTVTALNLKDGSILWKNKGFEGSPSAHTFDGNGTLYLCGYLSPDLYVINANGKTEHETVTFDDAYFWPSDIEVDGKYARIHMDAHPDQIRDEDSVIVVDLSDYTYKLPTA